MKPAGFVGLLVLGVMFCVPALAALPPASAPASAPAMDPRADALLKKMSDFLAQYKNLTFTAELSLVKIAGAEKEETTQSWQVFLQRPDHLAVVLNGAEAKGFSTYYDGQNFTIHVPAEKKFAAEKAGATIDETIRKFHNVLGQYPFIALLKSDVHQALLEGGNLCELGNLASVGGREAREIRLQMKQMAWRLWIETGEKPWPRKITVEASSPDGKNKALATALFSQWAAPAEIPPETFVFKPPAGDQKVESKATPPAPDFKLPVLDGGELELSKLKGQVVILDFWATWCGPCRKSLPVVSQVADSFKDRGVVFYAVNLQEDDNTIQGYLAKANLKMPVALDRDGRVSALYQVNGIPHTVIVGKDGRLFKIHVGYSANLKEILAQEVESALSAGEQK